MNIKRLKSWMKQAVARPWKKSYSVSSEALADGRAAIGLLMFVGAILSCLVFHSAQAQSGRRAPKPIDVAPVPTPSIDPATVPKPKPTPSLKIPVLVASYTPASIDVSTLDAELVQRTIIQRLGESGALATRGGEEMRRKDAEKTARNEAETYVVWLELENSSTYGGALSTNRDNPENYSIRFVVFAPQTGRTKAQGQISLGFYRRRSIGGIGLPGSRPDCYPNTNRNLDYAMVMGAIEAANRIISSFDLPLPPPCE